MLRVRILRSGFANKDLDFIHKQTQFCLQKHYYVLVNHVQTLAVSIYEKLIEKNELNFCLGIWELIVLNCVKFFRLNSFAL